MLFFIPDDLEQAQSIREITLGPGTVISNNIVVAGEYYNQLFIDAKMKAKSF